MSALSGNPVSTVRLPAAAAVAAAVAAVAAAVVAAAVEAVAAATASNPKDLPFAVSYPRHTTLLSRKVSPYSPLSDAFPRPLGKVLPQAP